MSGLLLMVALKEAVRKVPTGQSSIRFSKQLLNVSHAEMLYCALENLCTLLQFMRGHEFAGAMGDAYVARAEDHCLCPEGYHLRRFRAESDCAGSVTRRFFQKTNERRIRGGFHAFV